MIDAAAIRGRLMAVRDRIARAADRAGRDPSSITLVAVSKTFSAGHVRAAFDAGQADFGENTVQEALRKMPELSGLPIRWHLVGHLQSNKAAKAASHFDIIHSLDSAQLLGRLDEGAGRAGREIDLLVQIDLAREPTKHGARPEVLDSIFAAGRQSTAARVRGLMLLPMPRSDPEDARPDFAELRALRDDLAARGVDRSMLAELSMGMSHDFDVAVEEGATMVRVGTAIFGERNV